MGFWTGKKVLITGCSGLMGGFMAKSLLEQGADIRGFDRTEKGTLTWHDLVGDFHIEIGDLLDLRSVRHAMRDTEIVFHLGARSHVEDSRRFGYDTIMSNTFGTVNVLEAAKDEKAKAVLVASSNHVYGRDAVSKEDDQLCQLDTYSVSKICADYLTRAYHHNYGIPTLAVRNTNCFGPCDPHGDHIVPATIKSLLANEAPVIKSTGATMKAYLHVQDVVDAYLLLAEQVYNGNLHGEAINVSGAGVTVLSLVHQIIAISGKKIDPVVLGEANDQHSEFLDTERVRELGWEPKYDLLTALRETYEWFESEYAHVKETVAT